MNMDKFWTYLKRRGQALVDIQDTPGPETSVRHLAKSCLAHSLTSGRIPRQNSPV